MLRRLSLQPVHIYGKITKRGEGMVAYTVILFLVAVIFAVLAVLIFKGKTELIHDYHQTKVEDKAAYGKDFGKALGLMAVTMALSGIIALFGKNAMLVAVAVLLLGLVISIFAIIRVQKKHNGGMF
jgi:tellurite resistance protein TehA-like permease